MEELAIKIALAALVVTTINAILVAVDLWRRYGKKLECKIVKRVLEENGKTQFKFFVYVNNLKCTNICIEEVTYVLKDEQKGYMERQCIPSMDCLEPVLLNAYEAKLLPAHFISGVDVSQKIAQVIYIRIVTSKGVVHIPNPHFSNKLIFKKNNIKNIEKKLQEKREKILQSYINNESK